MIHDPSNFRAIAADLRVEIAALKDRLHQKECQLARIEKLTGEHTDPHPAMPAAVGFPG